MQTNWLVAGHARRLPRTPSPPPSSHGALWRVSCTAHTTASRGVSPTTRAGQRRWRWCGKRWQVWGIWATRKGRRR